MGPEWIWVAVIFLVLFGAKRLPELARSSGEALREFKKATREAMNEDDQPTTTTTQTAATEAPRRIEATTETAETSTTA